ncbi:MAG: hypothetical protein DWQ46_17275 [Planctomycetota bacterium]|nr:MAG: hypothetical protein DWQ46_17275 [Planctomycetota bacterium]
MRVVALWGVLIAVGVLLPAKGDWQNFNRFDVYGALVVLAVTGTLLLAWWLFLRARELRKPS